MSTPLQFLPGDVIRAQEVISVRRIVVGGWVAAWVGSVLAMAPGARAECRVTPGPEGELATWLVAGPVGRGRAPRGVTVDAQLATWITGSSQAAVHPAAGAAAAGAGGRWRAVAQDDDRFRVDTANTARDAWLAIEVRAARAQRLWLFAGADDGFAVFLDGHELLRRAGVHEAYDDDAAVALELTPGAHTLAIALHVNGGAMRWNGRVVDTNFRPPEDVTFALPGVSDTECDALGRSAAHVEHALRVASGGIELSTEISHPGGTAHRDSETSRAVRLAAGGAASVVEATIALAGRGVDPETLHIEVSDAASAEPVRLEIPGGDPLRVSIRVAEPLRRALPHAPTVLDPLDEAHPPGFLPLASLTSARWVSQRLAALVAARDGDTAHLLDEAATLEQLVADIEHGRDPYATRHGAMRRGYRSSIDGTLQGYSIYVPPSYHGDRPFPVIVALHGMGGTSHRMLPVLFGLYDEHEDREHADRHLPTLPDANAILVAPFGFGDAGYRALGETDVMTVLDEVRRAYRTDPARTYMTGLSMGGIGAASIPFHHPDVFAATAPLCGYHSYFVRHDTEGPRQPWETFLMEGRSNASWAENGLHLPLYVVHGTRDQPVANSRVLVDRYAALGYDVTSEWPELGHNVWSTTYADGRIVPLFLRYRHDAAPRHVRFRTASMRFHTSDWVSVDAMASHDAWAEIDATIEGAAIRVTTQGVRAFTIEPPASAFASSTANNTSSAPPVEISVRIDGDTLALRPGQLLSVTRAPQGHWAVATERTVETAIGPVRDLFDGPVLVVAGSHDAVERPMDLRVAQAWARIHGGIRAHVQVIDDVAVTPEIARTHQLVLVGTPGANSYLARLQSRLPIQVADGAVRMGTQMFRGEQVGAVFAAQNPEAPGRALLVITGVGALGVWRSRFLPELVPDYLIFDEHIAAARGRVILGAQASVLAGGFWGR